MKKEEIEELIAEYISVEISQERKKQLLQLFESDPLIKRQAKELLATWHSLDGSMTTFDKTGDAQFYSMLNNEKLKNSSRPKVTRLNWLVNIAAALILVVLAFILGRQTTPVKTSLITKTVIVKQPAPPAQTITKIVYVKAEAIYPAQKEKNKTAPEVNNKLQHQLRSVYPSDRLAAIMRIAKKTQLNSSDLNQLALVLKEDPSPNVRLATIDLLRLMVKLQNVQTILIGALNDQYDGAVQASIVDILLDNRLKQAIPQLVNLLQNKNTTAMMQEKIKTGIESFLN